CDQVVFFFSSRRRHTRFSRDWSSDVCSSDLDFPDLALAGSSPEVMVQLEDGVARIRPIAGTRPRGLTPQEDEALVEELLADEKRSEERRVGTEWSARRWGRQRTRKTANKERR